MSEVYQQLLDAELKSPPKQKANPKEKSIYDKGVPAKEVKQTVKREAKQYIKSLINPDRLKMTDRQFVNSVFVDKKLNHHDKVISDIKHGLLDEKQVPLKVSIPYDGCDTRDSLKGWNRKNTITITQKCINVSRKDNAEAHTKKNNLALSKGVPSEQINIKQEATIDCPKYKSVFVRAKEEIDMQRKEKKEDEALRQKIRKQCEYENPNAPWEKTSATVFRRLYEEKLSMQKSDIDKSEKLVIGKPDLSKTLKKEVEVKRHHDGKYGVTLNTKSNKPKANESEKSELMWSCCAKKDKDAPGCVITYVNRIKRINT